MNISQAAIQTGVSAKMIRYYEEVGLLPDLSRTAAGYRQFQQRDLERLHFIRRARDLAFSIAEIQELLSLWDDSDRKSADVKRLAQQHISRLQSKISAMQSMVDTLQQFSDACAGDDRSECPILGGLGRN